jgi:hypothetical protein
VNRKQRRVRQERRTYDGPRMGTAATMALGRVMAQASSLGVQATDKYISDNMLVAGFLPDGRGGWRSMTPVERNRWLGKDA